MYSDTPYAGRMRLSDRPTTAMVWLFFRSSGIPLFIGTVHFQQAAKALDLVRFEAAELARLQRPQLEEADAYALQLLHQTIEMFEHEANLVLPPFNQVNLIPWTAALLDVFQTRRSRAAAFDRHAVPKLLSLRGGERPVDLHQINLGNFVLRGSDTFCEVAVIGEQQQALAGIVEPADRVHPLLDAAQQIDHGGAALGVAGGGHDAARLVH